MLARQRDNAEAAVLQRGVEAPHAFARGAETDRGFRFVEAQHVDHRVLDFGRADGDPLIGDVAMPARLAGKRQAQCITLVAFGQPFDRAGHGGGEQQHAARIGSRVEDFLEIFAEAHVEHLVGLVEHHADQSREVERAAFEVVTQPSGRTDDDRGPTAQRAAFLARIHPANAGGNAQARTGIKPAKLAADLQRELAGGRDGQHQRLFGQRHAAGFAKQFGCQRETEGNGLAAAGLRGDDQVAAGRIGGDDGGLDRGGGFIAAGGQRFAENRRESFERHRTR